MARSLLYSMGSAVPCITVARLWPGFCVGLMKPNQGDEARGGGGVVQGGVLREPMPTASLGFKVQGSEPYGFPVFASCPDWRLL